MSNKRGFTLVELLAVIVIFAIILAIAIPGIGMLIKSSRISSYNSQMDLIKRAASLYAAQYGNEEEATVSLDELIVNGLISNSVINPITSKPFETGITVNIRKNNNAIEYEIYEGPELVTGMIPVYYDDVAGTWKKADKSNTSNSWYDYNNQRWANAITVTTATRAAYQTAAVGSTILETDVLTYFVWIPRFKYLIPAGTGPREINVSFETKYTPKSTGDAVSTYYTHPAFTLDDEELNGIWVGKFETTGSITAPTIKPNLQSIRDQTVKTMYDSVKTYMQGSSTYGFTNDNDVHMMKNMEWGAVAYLTGSRYGKYGNSNYIGLSKELYLNNSSSYYTGRSMGAQGGSGLTTTMYDGTNLKEYVINGYYTYDGKCASIYAGLAAPCTTGSTGQALTDKNLAYGASTTGTIYGIYDMSGGAYDYVMGVYKPSPIPAPGIADSSGYSTSTTTSQYDLLTINNKYYDAYLTNSADTGAILGDATIETAGWYGDYMTFVRYNNPWFARGSRSGSGVAGGVWSFYDYTGGVYGTVSFRVVLGSQ